MRTLLLLLGLAALLAAAPPAATAATPAVLDQGEAVEFPRTITFRARVQAPRGVAQVALEYGVDMLTCGDAVARVYPAFRPGPSADVSWTWDMREAGPPPPGATIWYRWHVTDTAGGVSTSETRHVTWLDDAHEWRNTSRGLLTLHYYEGDAEFAQELLATAEAALARLSRETGVAATGPTQLYIYADSEALIEALRNAPSWAGGVAYPEHSLVAIGIHPDDLEWGRRSIAHEITHVLVGERTFSCLGYVPTWLNEGLAVYGEGGPAPSEARRFESAVEENRLLPVRALSAGFSQDAEQAGLSYTQSYSMVRHLIERYGQAKLMALLDTISRGATTESGLRAVYGLGLEAFEDEWRSALGAAPAARADAAEPSPPAIAPTSEPTQAATASPAAEAPAPAAPPAEPPAAEPSAVDAPRAATPASGAAAEPAPPPQASAAPPRTVIVETPPPPERVALGVGLLVLSLPLGVSAGVGVLMVGTRRR